MEFSQIFNYEKWQIKSFSHKIEPNDPKIIKAIQDSINL